MTSFKLSLIGQRKIDRTSKNTYITVFINGLKAANDIPHTTLSSHEITFSYQYIIRHEYQLESIFNKWFCLLDTSSSNTDNLIHLYNSSKYMEVFYSIPMFLNISQALELYHNNILNKTLPIVETENPLPESDFNKIRETIERTLRDQSPEVKKWIMKKIKYDQSPKDKNFMDKLQDICKKADSVFSDFGVSLEDFSKKVRDTRNYYTHYGKQLREKASTGEDLYWLTQGISYLLLYCLLLELDFTTDHAYNMLRNNNKYRFAADEIKRIFNPSIERYNPIEIIDINNIDENHPLYRIIKEIERVNDF